MMYMVRLVNAGYSALYSYVGGGADHSFIADAGAVRGVVNSFSAPEKIGGTGFSDILKNFKGKPYHPNHPGYAPGAHWPGHDVATAGVYSRSAYSPLLGARLPGGLGASYPSVYDIFTATEGAVTNHHYPPNKRYYRRIH